MGKMDYWGPGRALAIDSNNNLVGGAGEWQRQAEELAGEIGEELVERSGIVSNGEAIRLLVAAASLFRSITYLQSVD
ncbi:MAG TPA: hypothetical protein VD902_00125 [Symbiobacteriaceae bacterium]|nr:hypothetical protein [Symbiobacteriaceae bacterium]